MRHTRQESDSLSPEPLKSAKPSLSWLARKALLPCVAAGATLSLILSPTADTMAHDGLSVVAAAPMSMEDGLHAGATNILPALETINGAVQYALGGREAGPCYGNPSTLRELQLLGGAEPTNAEDAADLDCQLFPGETPVPSGNTPPTNPAYPYGITPYGFPAGANSQQLG